MLIYLRRDDFLSRQSLSLSRTFCLSLWPWMLGNFGVFVDVAAIKPADICKKIEVKMVTISCVFLTGENGARNHLAPVRSSFRLQSQAICHMHALFMYTLERAEGKVKLVFRTCGAFSMQYLWLNLSC